MIKLQDIKSKHVLVVCIIFAGIFLSFFYPGEMGGEGWIYWLFAKIFRETGGLIVNDRGPLYTIYLSIFLKFSYPLSVYLEYIVTSFIVLSGMIAFFRKYIGLWPAVFAALLWLPFLHIADPPVQILALACSCWAMVIRTAKQGRFWNAAFYLSLGLAYLFRPSFLILIILFAAWDIYNLLKRTRSFSRSISMIRPRVADWPLVILAIFIVSFPLMQSDSPWNNSWGATSKWFPVDGKSLLTAGFFHEYNMMYIQERYGAPGDHDFYFTQKEIFGNATTIPGAITANPKFLFRTIVADYLRLPVEGIQLTAFFPLSLLPGISPALEHIFDSIAAKALIAAFSLALWAMIIYGGFKSARNGSIRLFFVGNLLMVLSFQAFSAPKSRYLLPLIPIMVFSAAWYGSIFGEYLRKRRVISARLLVLAVPFFLLVFSSGLWTWGYAGVNMASQISSGEYHLMEGKGFSMKASYNLIEPLIKYCKGILTYEHKFFVPFFDVPMGNVYDVFEIPPFGRLGDNYYDGLRPERINCLFLSETLMASQSYATNSQIRYANYIKPYAEELKRMGAKAYSVPRYGEVVILQGNKTASD